MSELDEALRALTESYRPQAAPPLDRLVRRHRRRRAARVGGASVLAAVAVTGVVVVAGRLVPAAPHSPSPVAASGHSCPADGPGTSASLVPLVHAAGRTYVFRDVVPAASVTADVVATTRCQLSGRTPAGHVAQDGDAMLPPGTPLRAVRGEEANASLAAEVGGEFQRYVAVPQPAAPSPRALPSTVRVGPGDPGGTTLRVGEVLEVAAPTVGGRVPLLGVCEIWTDPSLPMTPEVNPLAVTPLALVPLTADPAEHRFRAAAPGRVTVCEMSAADEECRVHQCFEGSKTEPARQVLDVTVVRR